MGQHLGGKDAAQMETGHSGQVRENTGEDGGSAKGIKGLHRGKQVSIGEHIVKEGFGYLMGVYQKFSANCTEY